MFSVRNKRYLWEKKIIPREAKKIPFLCSLEAKNFPFCAVCAKNSINLFMKKVSFICSLVIFLSCTPQINVKEKESVLLGELDKSYSAGKWEQALLYIDSLKDYGVS